METSPSLVTSTLLEVVPRSTRLLVGVSGGVDSMSLLHALVSVRSEGEYEIQAAHIDHGIRNDSVDDSQFVSETCKTYGIPLHLHGPLIPPGDQNIESWGRGERYRYFEEVRRKNNLDWILTAHTANDSAETLLMKLLSNKELTPIEERSDERRILRPFLHLKKSVLSHYAHDHGVHYREDSTNLDTKYLRNRVRHMVLPLIEQNFEGDTILMLAERSSSLGEDALFLRKMASEEAEALASFDSTSKEWLQSLRSKLNTLPSSVRWRLVEAILYPYLGYMIGQKASVRAMEFILGSAVGIELPGGIEIRRRNGGIVIGRSKRG